MAKIKFTGPEKRAYLRVSARCAVKYTKLSKHLRPLIGSITKLNTEDISAGGIKFAVRKKMPIRTILEFQFKIPGATRYVVGLGEVVRIKQMAGKKSYDVGLKFLWVHRKDAESIDAYVREKRIEEIIKKLHKR